MNILKLKNTIFEIKVLGCNQQKNGDEEEKVIELKDKSV